MSTKNTFQEAILIIHNKPNIVTHTCNFSTVEVEAGGLL